jgi:uncharacterized protein
MSGAMTKHLVDSNIFLEVLLQQSDAATVLGYLASAPARSLVTTDFALHSVGVVLRSLRRMPAFPDFVTDVVLSGRVETVSVAPSILAQVADVMSQHGLDFDDAYQYVAAEQHDLQIDFHRTPRGRIAPAQATAP